MEPDKKDTPESEDKSSAEGENKDEQASQSGDQGAPVDALSRTPDDLEKEEAEHKAAENKTDEPAEKKLSPVKQFLRKVNVYALVFSLIVVVAGIVTVVNYLNSQKDVPAPNIASQNLSQDALKQLANTDTSVGASSQTLTIQGNAVIAGQTLARGNLNVAGNLQTGGSIQGPKLTISGDTNLGSTQISQLQVAKNVAIQGTTTLRNLNVSGASSFSGALTASQITVTNLIMSGNASLQVPNHISFTGASPSRSVGNALGAGGSVSVNGSDTTGTINVNTGGSTPASGCFVRITFHQAFSNNPHVLISPVNEAAGATQYYVTRDTTGFSVCTANKPAEHAVFAYDYFVTN